MRGRHSEIQIRLSAEQQEVLPLLAALFYHPGRIGETGTGNFVAGAGTDLHADQPAGGDG